MSRPAVRRWAVRHAARLAAVAQVLALALPAAAQHVYAPPQPSPPSQEVRASTLRLNLGVAFYGGNFYACWESTSWCHTDAVGRIPFLVGAEVELVILGDTNAIGLGVNLIVGRMSTSTGSGPYQPWTFTAWEPVLDYVGSIGPPPGFVQGRFRVGLGIYVTPYPKVGVALRVGGGLSLFRDGPFGIGIDVVLEGGILRELVGGIQVAVSPEFHF
jgi:hypothetical protein